MNLHILLLSSLLLKSASSLQPIPMPEVKTAVTVYKCCDRNELIINGHCLVASQDKLWKPTFFDEHGAGDLPTSLPYILSFGTPQCKSRKNTWPVYNNEESGDRLEILSSGKLRHYISKHTSDEENSSEETSAGQDSRYYDYGPGEYCMDKAVLEDHVDQVIEFAVVCVPEIANWQDPDFILRRVVNPICHGIAICCLLVVAVIYFVLPQLCDLTGNIISSISICLIIAQIADVVRIFTEFNNEFSFLFADMVLYISLLAVFFWLNSFGYYIWKTFRSRNVFLRVTDGRKYCYYSAYVWGSTASMAAMALFAHFFLDMHENDEAAASTPIAQGAIGWLGIAVFFTPIAFIILVNIFFYLSTIQVIKRMSTYGRIHHKLKYSFDLFIKFFAIISINWFIFILSWLSHNSFFYFHILVNMFQAILLVYFSVINVKKIGFLLRKTCCYDKCIFRCCRPDEAGDTPEWGEEMMAMNTFTY